MTTRKLEIKLVSLAGFLDGKSHKSAPRDETFEDGLSEVERALDRLAERSPKLALVFGHAEDGAREIDGARTREDLHQGHLGAGLEIMKLALSAFKLAREMGPRHDGSCHASSTLEVCTCGAAELQRQIAEWDNAIDGYVETMKRTGVLPAPDEARVQ